MSNYHWYMKHFYQFETGIKPLVITWDTIETNRYCLNIPLR